MNKFFSIVITTFNRKELLLKCLESVSAQDFPKDNYDVCIVNDGSTDGTEKILEKKSFPFSVLMITVPNGGPSTARNIGASNAEGKFIVFLEDDVIAHSDWLKNAYRYLKNDDIDILDGRTIYQTTKKDVQLFDEEGYISFIPCNLFIGQTLFKENGGYDTEFNIPEENLYFREDTELSFRIMNSSIRIRKAKDVVVEHPEQFLTIKDSFRHALRYQFDPLLYKKHPEKFRKFVDVKKIFGIKLHRPHHYLYLVYVVSCLIFLVTILSGFTLMTKILLMLIIAIAFITRFKYQRFRAFRMYVLSETLGFFLLPFVYFYALIKGSIRYRSYGALL
ncbi:MAG: glycosyltransferase family A protein [bacterium]|nr:glycosyltransferase family A protein [bacterium]